MTDHIEKPWALMRHHAGWADVFHIETESSDSITGFYPDRETVGPPVTYSVVPGKVRTYANSMMPFDDLRLKAGVRLDAVLAPEQTVLHAIRAGYPLRVLPDGYAFREPLTVVTDKGDPGWTARIRAIIAAMRADGTLRAITLKWYGKDYSR